MPALSPRAVIVTRPTEYEILLARYGTRAQARFALADTAKSLVDIEQRHHRIKTAVATVSQAVPGQWRKVAISRSDLDRFIFEPADVIFAVGQDGLVANVAKYLDEQLVVGVNPDPSAFEGILVLHSPGKIPAILTAISAANVHIELRTMVQATLNDGQRLLALNEIFIGHRGHQSARYVLRLSDREERQLSSGIIVATGTGSTGWARSIHLERRSSLSLPGASDATLVVFVREAFPGSGFGTAITQATLTSGELFEIRSEMDEDGIIFGDGIEDDTLSFGWGSFATVTVAEKRLHILASVKRPSQGAAA